MNISKNIESHVTVHCVAKNMLCDAQILQKNAIWRSKTWHFHTKCMKTPRGTVPPSFIPQCFMLYSLQNNPHSQGGPHVHT